MEAFIGLDIYLHCRKNACYKKICSTYENTVTYVYASHTLLVDHFYVMLGSWGFYLVEFATLKNHKGGTNLLLELIHHLLYIFVALSINSRVNIAY